jgi:hypothetical protein
MFRLVKLVILHDIKNEEGIRAFLMEVWESYVKVGSLTDLLQYRNS